MAVDGVGRRTLTCDLERIVGWYLRRILRGQHMHSRRTKALEEKPVRIGASWVKLGIRKPQKRSPNKKIKKQHKKRVLSVLTPPKVNVE